MFCYQCEQTSKNTGGCAAAKGNCGKDATTSDLQDLLIYAVQGVARQAKAAREAGQPNLEADDFILYSMFTTLTNVNFNASRFVPMIKKAVEIRDSLKAQFNGPNETIDSWMPADDMEGLLEQAKTHGIISSDGADVDGARALILYGLKGVCAYSHHARVLGKYRQDIFTDIENYLTYLSKQPKDLGNILQTALNVGGTNLKVMEMLDDANTSNFGKQTPGQVKVSHVKGKCILISGHDMGDLVALLEQTNGKGINVYTHGEMLPAHAYPKLKAYPHLVGNYGGAWQDQQKDFAEFPGPILMTSNCIIEPSPQYKQRIFTTGPVGWPGCKHIENHAFAPVVQAAQALPGFTDDEEEKTITVGFGSDVVLGVADKVIDAVKSGAIKHFFLIGGCDGAVPGRNYYTEMAEKAPKDTVILTLGCNKFRFNKLDFGDIGGIPRLLDIGQCNDAHSALKIATALAGAFNCGVNDLPLSLIISWFEQKAAAVLLSLLYLGLKDIRLGPTLPAFITPTLLNILVEKYAIKPIGEAETDIQECMAA